MSDDETRSAIASEIEAVNKLPRLHLTIEEARALPEYSFSSPTDRTPFKRWRRHNGASNGFSPGGPWPHWLVCEYGAPQPHPNRPGTQVVPILIYRVAIRVPAATQALEPTP